MIKGFFESITATDADTHGKSDQNQSLEQAPLALQNDTAEATVDEMDASAFDTFQEETEVNRCIPVLFVEILGRHHDVKERIKIDRFPATLGRAYHNQVIIDDPYISPEHAEVSYDPDTGFAIRDLGSRNGIWITHQSIDRKDIPPTKGLTFTLGKTTIRIRTTEHRVSPTSTGLLHNKGIWQLLTRTPIQAAFAAFAFFLIALEEYQTSTSSFMTNELPSLLILLLLLTGWSGFWALINRIVSHRFRFFAHMATVNLILAFFTVFEVFVSYLFFITGAGVLYSVFPVAILSILIGTVLYAHLSLIGVVSVRKKTTIGLSTAMLVLALISLSQFSSDEQFSAELDFYKTLKPVDNRLLLTVSKKEFLADTEDLKRKVDERINRK